MSEPTISAALIVKNEESNLDRCLKSLKGVVDEIVVVDTGSSDRTIEIAESYGAKVGHFEWCDDFSAARNHSLQMVSSEWMLMIDADDELHLEKGFPLLFQSLKDANAIFVPIKDAFKDALPQSALRLFKVVHGMTWIRPVHEELVVPDPRYGYANGFFHYVHYGYTGETAPEKLTRNISLLEKHLRSSPDDARSLLFLARELAWLGRHDEGLKIAQQLLEQDLEESLMVDAFAVAAWNALGLEQFQEVEAITKSARHSHAASVWTEYMRAVAFLHLNNKTRAREAIGRACDMNPPVGTLLGLHYILGKRFELKQALMQS